jgi:hypothetical protein
MPSASEVLCREISFHKQKKRVAGLNDGRECKYKCIQLKRSDGDDNKRSEASKQDISISSGQFRQPLSAFINEVTMNGLICCCQIQSDDISKCIL